MKRMPSSDEAARFKGGVRHYHRAGAKMRSWDEWVNGPGTSNKPKKNWLKIIGISLALVVLVSIIVGLIVELGWR